MDDGRRRVQAQGRQAEGGAAAAEPGRARLGTPVRPNAGVENLAVHRHNQRLLDTPARMSAQWL